MHARLGLRMPLDDVTTGKGVVETSLQTFPAADGNCLRADPRVSGPTSAIAEYDWRNSIGWGRHRVTVEQKGAAKTVDEQRELSFD